jgi:hypothetical protein
MSLWWVTTEDFSDIMAFHDLRVHFSQFPKREYRMGSSTAPSFVQKSRGGKIAQRV